jgi:hypothetical protein
VQAPQVERDEYWAHTAEGATGFFADLGGTHDWLLLVYSWIVRFVTQVHHDECYHTVKTKRAAAESSGHSPISILIYVG